MDKKRAPLFGVIHNKGLELSTMNENPTPGAPDGDPPVPPETPPAFAKVFRGYDPAEVDDYIASLIARLKLHRAHLPDSELSGEQGAEMIDTAASDIAELLQSARLAAEKIRGRADRQIATDLTVAETEAGRVRADAEADAYAMRKSAWDMAAEALESLEGQAAEMEAEADRKALAIIGESERTAHRNLASARREGERLMQEAGAQAERMLAQAREKSEEMMTEGERRVEVIRKQIRLESKRRDGLAAEVNELRSKLDGPPPFEEHDGSAIRLVPPAERGNGDRVRSEPEPRAPADDPPEEVRPVAETPAVDGQDMAEEVARLRETAEANGESPAPARPPAPPPEPVSVRSEPEEAGPADPEPDREQPPPRSEPDPAAGERASVLSAPPVSERELAKMWSTGRPLRRAYDEAAADSFGSLFEDLRRLQETEAGAADGPAASAKSPAPPSSRAAVEDKPAPARPAEGSSAAERYHMALFPIANRALRNIKRRLIDIQNQQLEDLKNDPADWQPERARLEESLVRDLTIMHREAFAAGRAAAGEMLEGARAAPALQIPAGESELFVSALFDDLVLTVQAGRENGQGARQLGAALSQAYRVWRTDEAERRVRFLAGRSYHRGLLAGFRQAGVERFRPESADLRRGCAYDVGDSRPVAGAEPFPDHHDCRCTLVPA